MFPTKETIVLRIFSINCQVYKKSKYAESIFALAVVCCFRPIESRKGISPPRSHRTGRDSLPSSGSSC